MLYKDKHATELSHAESVAKMEKWLGEMNVKPGETNRQMVKIADVIDARLVTLFS